MIVIREIKCTNLEEFRLEICKKLMTYFGMACKKGEKQTVVEKKKIVVHLYSIFPTLQHVL